MVPAVNGHTGYARGPDYRWVDAMGAYTYLPKLDVGMVVKNGVPLLFSIGTHACTQKGNAHIPGMHTNTCAHISHFIHTYPPRIYAHICTSAHNVLTS